MNKYFTETGATVLIQGDNDKTRHESNRENIEAILLLENDKERINKKIESLNTKAKQIKSEYRKSYLKNHKTFISGVVGVVAAKTIGLFLANKIFPNTYFNLGLTSPFGIFATIVLLLTKEESYHKFRVEKDILDNKKKENKKLVKNLNILKFSVDRELKVERKAELFKEGNTKTKKISNLGLVDFKILDYYDENHDILIEQYKNNKTVDFYNNEFNTRILSDMVQKEIYDEKNNLSFKDKAKKKIKNKIDKLLG